MPQQEEEGRRAQQPHVSGAAASPAHIANLVNAKNLDHLLPHMLQAIRTCDFVAVDTEFTGLSSSPDVGSPNLQVRYESMRQHVNNYALLQLGLSFFRKVKPAPGNPCGGTEGSGAPPGRQKELHRYESVTYTLNLLQQEDFIVSSSSMQFLAKSGAGLDLIFGHGIPFHFCFESEPSKCAHCSRVEIAEDAAKVRNSMNGGANSTAVLGACRNYGTRCRNKAIAHLFQKIAARGVPVVVHNGLMDLQFLHASFFK